MRVVATAGHVDHGKSTLVRALTGIDPDRLAEEKARGLTIDLGFAATTLPSGAEVAFVDVPGHARFIANMLSGVGGVDACLFVVAATEGWKPQSEEHLRILELLGITRGVIALTKVDLVDDEQRAIATEDVRAHVEGTFLADAPITTALPELQAALEHLVGETPASADHGRPRLWVDRAFPVAGAGTVVTGTLTGGALTVGDVVTIIPGGHSSRIRQMHSHHVALTRAEPGRRVAVNIPDIPHDAVRRGTALVVASQWHVTDRVDASLRVLVDHDVTRKGAYKAYIGSGEHPVRVQPFGEFVRLWLPVGLPLQPGDRYVLRESGRGETVGGGTVLDVSPVLRVGRARPSISAERIVAERGWVRIDELAPLLGTEKPPLTNLAVVGGWVVDPSALASATAALTGQIEAAGSAGVDLAVLSEQQRAVLGQLDVAVRDGRAYASLPPIATDLLESSGVDAAASVVADLLAQHPDGVTVAQVRDALGVTRKHVIPLLGHLDATGVTRRRGDVRIGGPLLPLAGERRD